MSSLIPPEHFRTVIENCSEPFIVEGILNWDLLHWDIHKWEKEIGSNELTFRLGKSQHTENPQWEKDSKIVKGKFKDFWEFCESSKDEWLYFDYKYLREWLLEVTDLQKNISWKAFGYPDLNFEDSTIWMGSKGAHTPCHIDSYGFNLVAQVLGRKRWLLFPPEENLLPTRVPYEESSIYSMINFFCPDLQKIKGISSCREIILKPGQVLFVPNGWWHYVENLEIAISVNVWISQELDTEKRLEECICQMIVSQFSKNLDVESRHRILQTNSDNINLHEKHIDEYMKILEIENTKLLDSKRKKLTTQSKEKIKEDFNIPEFFLKHEKHLRKLHSMLPEDFQKLMTEQFQRFPSERKNENVPDIKDALLKAVTHPETINVIKKHFMSTWNK